MTEKNNEGQPAAAGTPNPDLHKVLPGERTWLERSLNVIEVVGNKLPDPAVLFFLLMIVVWVLSALLAPVEFSAVHPSTGEAISVVNQLSGDQMANFLVNMVSVFVNFAPLGIVLVALLGVGVSEHTGFINAGLRKMLGVKSLAISSIARFVLLALGVLAALYLMNGLLWTDLTTSQVLGRTALGYVALSSVVIVLSALVVLLCRWLGLTADRLLTPLLILIAIISHTAADAGYVVVIPLGAVIFYAAGRHPLAGIAAAFAGVSGGFSANFIPSAIDPMLAGITEAAGQVINPDLYVNPLANWGFMAASSVLVIIVGWWLTDKIIEPRLIKDTPVDGDMSDMPKMEELADNEQQGLKWAMISIAVAIILLILAVMPPGSPLRDPSTGGITSFGAPLMRSIVPLIFILFVIPGIVYGYVARTVESHKDIIAGMTQAMESMGYYIVMAFFAAQFIAAFSSSNLGILIAVNGAEWLGAMGLPAQLTIVGIIGLSMFVNLFVGSASAKWLIIAPIFVPMLMQLGISPELTQAAYRVGDSTSNIITPLLPYFPLIVVFCRRYFKGSGIGTLISMMLPYAVVLAIAWTGFLLLYWALGLPLGLQASYTYPV